MFYVVEVFIGSLGKYVDLKDIILGFKGFISGNYDDLLEMVFYMVGDMNEVILKVDEFVK